jgi:hypothetical protein
MVTDVMHQAVAGELLDVVERAKEERLRLLRQLREVESRVAAAAQAARPPGEVADVILRRIEQAEARLAQRLTELKDAEAALRRHSDAAVRIEASLSRLSGTLTEQLEVVRPAVKEVGQIKQQLRDAAHAAIEQTRTSLEALRSPVMEELARLERCEQTAAEQVEAVRARVEAQMQTAAEHASKRMQSIADELREQAGEILTRFAEAMREQADQRVDERIDRVNEQLDHHLRAVNHRLLAQQQQISDLLDQRQEHAVAMLADAEGVIEQCAAQFDEAQQQINARLLQQRLELTAMLDARHQDAVAAIKATQPDISHVAAGLGESVRAKLQEHVDAAMAEAAGSLQHQATELRDSFAAMVQVIKSRAAKELEANHRPAAKPEAEPRQQPEVAGPERLAAQVQEIAHRVGVRPRPTETIPDSSLHVG